MDDPKKTKASAQAPAPPPETPITPEIMTDWNNFLTDLHKKGLAGSHDLDKKDTDLGRKLIEEYRAANPNALISYDMVKPIQRELQRKYELAKQVQSNPEVRKSGEFAQKLSPEDGWLGSVTSTSYFPTATTSDPKTGKVIKDWKFDLEGYYASLQNKK